jgi:putative hydrolase of the HAD superfamily
MSVAPLPIEAMLFDVEGVIAHPEPSAADHRLAGLAPGFDLEALTRARNTARTYPLWEQYSVGAIGPQDYWHPILEEAGLPDTPETLAALRGAQREAWWAAIDETVLALIDTAREAAATEGRRLRMGILSNSAPEHERYVVRFAGHFDAACFSHRTGYRKPDPAAYQLACAAVETPPERVLFIDDKERNVLAARKFGIHALVFSDAATLGRELADMGLLGR